MGIGSSLKKLAGKVIPKEVGKIAPVVSLFNPALGAMMGVAGGLQQGNLGQAALAGLGNYGLGSFAGGAGMPQFGGTGSLTARMLGGLGNIPGVSQLSGSSLGQGVGNVMKGVQGQGSKFGNMMRTGMQGTDFVKQGAEEYGYTPSVDGKEGDRYLLDAAGQTQKGGLPSLLGSIIQTGSGAFGVTLGDLLGFGAGYMSDRAAKKDMEQKLASSGFNKSLAQVSSDYPLSQTYQTGTYRTGGPVRAGYNMGGTPARMSRNYDQYDDRVRELDDLILDRQQEDILQQMIDMGEIEDLYNQGGRVGLRAGGLGSIPQTSNVPQGMQLEGRGGGFIPMGAQEKKDDVPAMLAKNEFVMTADAVRAAGGGSINQGAKRMYNMMHQLENQGAR